MYDCMILFYITFINLKNMTKWTLNNSTNYWALISENSNLISNIPNIEFLYLEKNYWEILSNLNKNIKILEIWPWNTFCTQYLLNKWFINIDLVEYSEDLYKEQEKELSYIRTLNFYNDDALIFLDWKNNNYDLIILRQVIEHIDIENIPILLSKLYNATKLNWKILIETTNAMNFFYWNYYRFIDITHKLSFTTYSFNQFLKLSNIDIYKINFHNIFWVSTLDGIKSLFIKNKQIINEKKNISIKVKQNLFKKFFIFLIKDIIYIFLNIFNYIVLFNKENWKIIFTEFILFEIIKNKND